MQRLHMVAFDKALASVSIRLPEVKAARLAHKRPAARQHAADLPLAQRGLSLPYSVQTQQVPAFHDTLVLVADKLRSILWFILPCSPTQILCKTMHLLIIVKKFVEHFLVKRVAVTWRSDVVGVHGGDVVGLTSYARSEERRVGKEWRSR